MRGEYIEITFSFIIFFLEQFLGFPVRLYFSVMYSFTNCVMLVSMKYDSDVQSLKNIC